MLNRLTNSARQNGQANPAQQHLQDVMEREWFSRTWTIQELLLSKSALVMCGTHSISALKLARFVSIHLPWSLHNPCQDGQQLHRVQGQILLGLALKDHETFEQVDAMQLMMVVRSAEVTDAKDKVIGVQAILSKIGISLPPLSYAMPVAELYAALTQAWIDHWNNLQILALAGSSGVTAGLASWVPDWNNLEQADAKVVSDHYTRLVYSRCIDSVTKHNISATRNTASQHAFAGINSTPKLTVSGHFPKCVVLRQVRGSGAPYRLRVGSQQNGKISPPLDIAPWLMIARTVISWATFLLHCTREYRLCDMLACLAAILNVGPKVLITMRYQQYGLAEDLRRIADIGQGELSKEDLMCESQLTNNIRTSQLWIALSLRCETETLCITNDGRLGLCYSRSILEGDIFALVAGSDLPLILRQNTTQAGCYSFVGSAILSDLPGERRLYRTLWEDRPEGQTWREYVSKPPMPADDSWRRNLWNSRFLSEKAVVSSLMRGELWQEAVVVDSLVKLTLV